LAIFFRSYLSDRSNQKRLAHPSIRQPGRPMNHHLPLAATYLDLRQQPAIACHARRRAEKQPGKPPHRIHPRIARWRRKWSDQIRSKRRSFDAWQGELKFKEIAKYIDKGVPLMWCLYSTKDFNETANKRTKERKDVKEWASWKTKVATESATNSLPKDKETAHIVLIIGYNKDTNEIAFSDSWGEKYKERWITLPEAEQVSQQRFYVVGF
jgi:hypothetical protein